MFDTEFSFLPLVKIDRFKGSSDLSHFLFEINVGKGQIRHKTTLQFNF